MLNAILAALAPHIPEIAAILAGVIVTGLMLLLRAAAQAVRQWGMAHGVQADALRADALSQALERAARLALERKLTGDAALNLMVGYVLEALPDTVAALGASGTALRNRAAVELARATPTKIRM